MHQMQRSFFLLYRQKQDCSTFQCLCLCVFQASCTLHIQRPYPKVLLRLTGLLQLSKAMLHPCSCGRRCLLQTLQSPPSSIFIKGCVTGHHHPLHQALLFLCGPQSNSASTLLDLILPSSVDWQQTTTLRVSCSNPAALHSHFRRHDCPRLAAVEWEVYKRAFAQFFRQLYRSLGSRDPLLREAVNGVP